MGCKASESIFLGQFPEIIVDYEITPLSCKDQEDAAIDLSIIGGTQNYVFNWSNGEFTEDIANLASGYYNVVVTDDNGCTKSIDFFIDQSFEPCLFIPSSFSPNADGINDVWVLRNIDRYPNCEVLVFNRWGKKVFESISYSEPWDGTYKGNAVPAETYYYIIDLNNGDEPYNGTVTIVR
jgi:gliding motility-associated-like protein